jgi:diguanylate cyclase (GGDEF)-like protein/PAS domain S-box-containing protein
VQRTHQLTQELAERKKQEQALKVSKERLEAAAKAGIVGIWDWDVVKNQLIWDKVMYSLYGIREEDFGGAYEAWSATVHPDDKARVDDEIKAALSHEREYSPEFRVIWPDGSIHFLKAESHTSFDEQGKPLRIVGVNYDLTKQKIIEQELEDLYENAPCGYHSIGPDGIYQRINATELAWLGCTREEVIGKKSPCDFYTHPSQELFRQAFPNFVRDGYSENLEFDLVGKEGTNRHVIMNATAIRDGNGNFLNSRSVMYDITELKQIEDKLHQLTLEQHAMLDNELVGMAKLKNRHIVWKNKAFDGMFGYGAAELNGQSLRILYPDDAQFQAVGEVAYPILNAQGVYRTPLELLRKNGETIWVDSSSIKLNNVNEEFLWTIVDITPIKQHQEKIERIAYHDILTDLPNRLLLSDRLEQALAQTERLEKLLAVCYIDLDGFKPINDNFGHAAGDELLKEIANRMEGSVRTNDTVSRIGGDEFCLLLTNLENVQEYQTVLQRVIDSINKPVRLERGVEVRGVEVNVTASIGITLFPFDTDDPDTLLRHADQAMYQAKKAGRNRVYLYSSDRTGGTS